MSNAPCRSKDVFLVAANVLESWLRVCDVACVRQGDEKGPVAEVQVVGHGSVYLQDGPTGSGLRLDARRLASMSRPMAEAEFWLATRAMGLGQPNVFRVRGERPKRDPYFVAARLSEYSMAPDLDSHTQAQYATLLRPSIRRYYRFRRMESLGFDCDELLTLGNIWAANFHHRWRRRDPETNERNVQHYVRQRLQALRQKTLRSDTQLMTPTYLPQRLQEDGWEQGVAQHQVSDVQELEADLAGLWDKARELGAEALRSRIEIVCQQRPELAGAARGVLARVA